MTVSEKVAYLKGLADGLGVKDSTNEGKLMLAVIDVLEAMAYDIALNSLIYLFFAVFAAAATSRSMRSPAPSAARPSPFSRRISTSARSAAPSATRSLSST